MEYALDVLRWKLAEIESAMDECERMECRAQHPTRLDFARERERATDLENALEVLLGDIHRETADNT